ncbi:MAG: hypothetical protein QG629_319 [Patescibacteria group bacterium]|nr:hypothetical protein [Candidatus Saccharibacteria bacterium]MDQ5963237.1 hypothetical protein [Patescibacteria group bacterium]
MQTGENSKDSFWYTAKMVLTRMVPTAIVVFLLLFSFFPKFGNPVSNLRGLGGDNRNNAQQKAATAAELASGLAALQSGGGLDRYFPMTGGTAQQLQWDASTKALTITGGNTVNLAGFAQGMVYGTMTQTLAKNGNSLTITGSGTNVDLASYLDNTDGQTMSLSGSILTITGGNAINLAPINTDSQTLSLTGSTIAISSGNTLDLASINTDMLATLSCSVGQILQWDGGAWVCASPAASSDSQTLSLSADSLSILNGNSVSLAGYLDNTDAQELSYNTGTHVLSISGSAATVNLSALLDNTDTQSISRSGNTISISGSSSTVDLSPYVNADTLASLSCSANQVAKWVSGAWACANDVDTQLTEAQVDAYANNNGYLTSFTEVDGSTTNELQNLFLTVATPDGNNPAADGQTDILTLANGAGISITSDGATDTITIASTLGTSIDSSEITDGTIVAGDIANGTLTLAKLGQNACSDGQVVKWSNTSSAWVCSNDIDTQLTEAQVDAYANNNGYLTSFTEVDGSTTNEIQDLSKSGNTLSLSGDSTSVDLSGYLDNTDILASLSCTNSQVAKWNSSGSAWQCANDIDTQLTEAQVDAYANNNGYLTSFTEVDGSISNELQDLSLSSNVLTITGLGTPTQINLAGYLDNTDALAALSCVDGKIVKRISGVWACGDDVNTTYSAGAGVLIDGSNVVSSVLGTDIASAEIVDGTITAADIANGTITNAKLATSSLTITAGTGLSGGGSVSLGGSVTLNLANDFGNSIDSSEITNGTIATVDIADGAVTASKLASCSSDGQILKYTTASGWACGSDVDTDTNTTYSAGTGISINGSNVISTALGTSIDSSEITDGTIAAADIADGTITLAKLGQNSCTDTQVIKWSTASSAWVCATDNTVTEAQVEAMIFDADNTGTLSSGTLALGSLSYTGSLADTNVSDTLTIGASSTVADGALSSTVTKLGQTIESGEITDGTIVAADLANGTVTASKLASCSSDGQILKYTTASGWACGSDVDTDTNTTYSAGTGVSIDGSNVIATTLGTSIDSSEITDGTIATGDLADASITLAKIASNSCTNNQIMKFNGSAWVCAADSDTTYTEASIEAMIFDADNTGTLSSGTLALGSLSYTGTLGDSNISDALTISSSGTVADGALSSTVTKLGQTIESSEITNGTVTGTDLASATILFSNIAQNGCTTNQIMKWNGTDWGCAADATGGTVNSFETISTSAGTSPVADSSTDTLTLSGGSGVTVTGDGTTDTITIAATLGSDITSAEIVDGTIVNADIANGTVSNVKLANSAVTVTAGTGLSGGGSVSLGSSVTLNLANDFGASIDSGEITDGTVAFVDLGQNGCSNNQVIKWSTASTAWVCGTDVDTQLTEAQVDAYANNNGYLTSFTESDGVVGNEVTDATTNGGLTRSGSGTGASPYTLGVAVGDGVTLVSGKVTAKAIGSADGLSSTTSSGSGLEVLPTGVTMLQGCSDAQILKWNETSDVWACANDIDTDTQPSEAAIEAYIFDADNTGTLSSGTLALGSLSYTGVLTDTNISDTLTVGATSSVSDSALSSNVTKLGSSIESSEITDGTIVAADMAADSLDFTEFKDSMTLDATTTIAAGANNLAVNLDGTGDFVVQDSGVTSFTVTDTGGVYIGDPASAIATGSLLVLDNITTDPTGVAGAMYYNATSGRFRCYSSAWHDCKDMAYANTSVPAGDTIANTVTETNFASTYTVPAGDCVAGRVYRVTARGVYSTTTTAPTLNIRMKWDATVLDSTGNNATSARMANRQWELSADVICNSTTQVEMAGGFRRSTSATAAVQWEMSNTAPVTIANTSASTLAISAQFGTANATNNITLRQLIVEAIGP